MHHSGIYTYPTMSNTQRNSCQSGCIQILTKRTLSPPPPLTPLLLLTPIHPTHANSFLAQGLVTVRVPDVLQ